MYEKKADRERREENARWEIEKRKRAEMRNELRKVLTERLMSTLFPDPHNIMNDPELQFVGVREHFACELIADWATSDDNEHKTFIRGMIEHAASMRAIRGLR